MFIKRNFLKSSCEKGSLMIEAIAMLGLISMISPMLFRQASERQNELADIAVANQTRALTQSVNDYIRANQTDLSKAAVIPIAPPGNYKEFYLYQCVNKTTGAVVNYPGAGHPSLPNLLCIIDYLPRGVVVDVASTTSAPNSLIKEYKVSVRNDDGKLTGMLVGVGSLGKTGKDGLPRMRASRIASMIGSQGGFGLDDSGTLSISGSQGTWQIDDVADFFDTTSFDPGEGSIFSTTTFEPMQEYSEYLHRHHQAGDPDLNKMFTDLLFDGASGIILSGGNITGAGSINGTTVNATTVNATTVNATTVNATDVFADLVDVDTVDAVTVNADKTYTDEIYARSATEITFKDDVVVEGNINADEIYANLVDADTVKAIDVNATNVDATNVYADLVDADTVKAILVDADTVKAILVDADTVKAIDVDATNVYADLVDATTVKAIDVDATNVYADLVDADTVKAIDVDATNVYADLVDATTVKAIDVVADTVTAGFIDVVDLEADTILATDITATNITTDNITINNDIEATGDIKSLSSIGVYSDFAGDPLIAMSRRADGADNYGVLTVKANATNMIKLDGEGLVNIGTDWADMPWNIALLADKDANQGLLTTNLIQSDEIYSNKSYLASVETENIALVQLDPLSGDPVLVGGFPVYTGFIEGQSFMFETNSGGTERILNFTLDDVFNELSFIRKNDPLDPVGIETAIHTEGHSVYLDHTGDGNLAAVIGSYPTANPLVHGRGLLLYDETGLEKIVLDSVTGDMINFGGNFYLANDDGTTLAEIINQSNAGVAVLRYLDDTGVLQTTTLSPYELAGYEGGIDPLNARWKMYLDTDYSGTIELVSGLDTSTGLAINAREYFNTEFIRDYEVKITGNVGISRLNSDALVIARTGDSRAFKADLLYGISLSDDSGEVFKVNMDGDVYMAGCLRDTGGNIIQVDVNGVLTDLCGN